MDEQVIPIKSISADEYATMIRTGTLLLRIQSQIVAVAVPLKCPIPIERGDPAGVITRKFREWKERERQRPIPNPPTDYSHEEVP